MHSVVDVVVVIAIVGYVIGRQLVGEPVRGKRLIVLPAVLVVIGAIDLHSSHLPARSVDIVILVVSGVVAAAIGTGQGWVMRLESRDGVLWAQLPATGLLLWAALVAARIGLTGVALASHAHLASSSSTIILMLGINRLSQAAVVAPRAIGAGVPFAPEKDGQTFLGQLFGNRNNDARNDGPVGRIDLRALLSLVSDRIEAGRR